MNSQLAYLVAKAHIDELVRAAERGRMSGGRRSRSSTVMGRGLAGRLRRVGGRSKASTGSGVCAECP
jgi:hypothetical protein